MKLLLRTTLAILYIYICSGFAQTVVYENDFETSAGTEWSSNIRDISPTGRTFLGRFVNDAYLTLSIGSGSPIYPQGLPEHDSITVSFDLFIIHSWDGAIYSDKWWFGTDGQEVFLTSFANPLNGTAGNLQSFPGTYPDDLYTAHSGAEEINTLGYWNVSPTRFGDSVYHLSFTLPHTEDSVLFDFVADGYTGTVLGPGLADESWGIDNIEVFVTPEPATFLLLGLSVTVLRKKRFN